MTQNGLLLAKIRDGFHKIPDCPVGVQVSYNVVPNVIKVLLIASCFWLAGFPRFARDKKNAHH
jgi:hypothetical protein